MKRNKRHLKVCLILILLAGSFSCSDDESSSTGPEDLDGIDFRQEMREFVMGLSDYTKSRNSPFLIITQNGQELITRDGEPDGPLASSYLAAVDGVGQEDLFYGYDVDDVQTPPSETDWLVGFLDLVEAGGKEVLVTDYCSGHGRMDDSYTRSEQRGYVSFAADHRELDNVPAYPAEPNGTHSNPVHTLAETSNFLYLINPGSFGDRDAYLDALQSTKYDLLLVDAFYEETALTSLEVERLGKKPNGASRLVIAYMSIGEAEDYRYYWDSAWAANRPKWLESENPDWPGNYRVRYWESGWQEIIYGSDDSYLHRLFDAGFDGVYLDIIEGYEYFEELVD